VETIWLPALLKEVGLAPSTSEARRLIVQGGVKVDGERVESDEAQLPRQGDHLLQVGRRRFLRVRFQ